MPKTIANDDTVRSSRDGHTFHERWTARRALQLVFPKDDLCAIAVEGLSVEESTEMSSSADEIADLVLYYGNGATFESCSRLETIQFKYRASPGLETSSYLRKTIEKFCDTILDYRQSFSDDTVDAKLSFCFVTNTEFSDHLKLGIEGLKKNVVPETLQAKKQYKNLRAWCEAKGVDAQYLLARTSFQAETQSLPSQVQALQRTVADWSAGPDYLARNRLFGLTERVREKAGLSGQNNNLIKREDVLDALACHEEDLFPADTQFIDVKDVIDRDAVSQVVDLIDRAMNPVFVHAAGGVGKTVFVQSLAAKASENYEAVVFDCFGGGSYRIESHARHLPSVGLIQIVNEFAKRGHCDPLLPYDADHVGLIKAALRRLTQCAETIPQRSLKRGVLIIIDAADNAQVEADLRKQQAFPRLLLEALSASPIPGVKLLLTARSHRMEDVIGRNQVERFALGPFSESESKEFLRTRKANATPIEIQTAITRSRGNARVLEHLVDSWELNVRGMAGEQEITAEKLIAQKCDRIFADLHVKGWPDKEIREFFAAISLLPPPVPLEELANALGWPLSQVDSAASDLAPMLEVQIQGAIFRDEPTETYIHDTYSTDTQSQQAIAERLSVRQSQSLYAAEALPNFLVAINDSDRAFLLAGSSAYPTSVQSAYGRRRLRQARLFAAFRLAVTAADNDRVLRLIMKLVEVASANAKGDHFIRLSPSLAVLLGDRDVSRRLFNDRTGWHGARNARLTVSHIFQGEIEEAAIHANRTGGWIRWYLDNRSDDERYNRSGPRARDFSAVLMHMLVSGKFELVSRNLSTLGPRFAFSVVKDLIGQVHQFDLSSNGGLLNRIAAFAGSKNCRSIALQLSLLSQGRCLQPDEYRRIARASSSTAADNPKLNDTGRDYDHTRSLENEVGSAALVALLFNSRQSATRILATAPTARPRHFDYGERHGPSRIWTPVLFSYLSAWTKGTSATYYHLAPSEVGQTAALRGVSSRKEFRDYLAGLKVYRTPRNSRRSVKKQWERQYSERECDGIADGVDLALALSRPLEAAVLEKKPIDRTLLHDFVVVWKASIRTGIHWRSEEASDILVRAIGVELAKVLLRLSSYVDVEDANTIVEIISGPRFSISERLEVLDLLSRRDNLGDVAGSFAETLSAQINADESIEQRGENDVKLAEVALQLGRDEAKEYYKIGLSQLDQMGGDDYDLVYSILRYAEVQHGGFLKPELGQRLMNLCQIICYQEPSKFGWTLFGSAAARSIGFSAINKLIRWGDQDVADFSYGLPQLACFLASNGSLDPRRAAVLLTVCDDHGWHEWQVARGLSDALRASQTEQRAPISHVVVRKLLEEHWGGGWSSGWKALIDVEDEFPGALSEEVLSDLKRMAEISEHLRRKEDQARSYQSASEPLHRREEDFNAHVVDYRFAKIVQTCDVSSASSIDESLGQIEEDKSFSYGAKREFVERLRETCLDSESRISFTYALCEVHQLRIDDIVDHIIKNCESWRSSSIFLANNARLFIERLFEHRGSEIFDLKYSGISRTISRLAALTGDRRLIIGLVLSAIANEGVELSGDEWLEVAASICATTSPEAALGSLEDLLAGPAAKIGDDIGEGAFQERMLPAKTEQGVMADALWHLLGHPDAFIRWSTARAVASLAELSLLDDLCELLARFDCREVKSLKSENEYLAFQNSQLWLLMGLSRAALMQKDRIAVLKPKLVELSSRDDLHAIHKLHIARCLRNLSEEADPNASLMPLWEEINIPPHGCTERGEWPGEGPEKSDFSFEYDFDKYQIAGLARLFGISQNEAQDALGREIMLRWPEVTSMDQAPGHDRFRRDRHDRTETFREHMQMHALLQAATSLLKTKPIVRASYDSPLSCPWVEWLSEHDIHFEEGSWLADRKDGAPIQAFESLLGPRIDRKETLQGAETLLTRIGLLRAVPSQWVPIYGHWKSRDGVYVRIVSTLTKNRGAVKSTEAFVKQEDHDLWMPMLESDGYASDHRKKPPFDAWIWEREAYPIGIDEGDELATRGAANRPRLGRLVANELCLKADDACSTWFTESGQACMRSQVWGGWQPDREGGQFQNEGAILWASPLWLDASLSKLGMALAYSINFSKSPSYKDYDDETGVRAVYVGLRLMSGNFRYWHAKKASRRIY
ncbi:hypothetical protein BYZ73_00470 [Rhodovulum viride]|uniref:NACHT domain-containing protein n=1 Tax=Rhodovulum viride TaxID=1231134 RepID=A0ABX9DLX3_9RHOB|nr:NACHT domain-containing protein [Rhodovulum viride]RAP43392.1 hypothetical protein BYZ73_00470 [Rhodovulum viride]